LEPFLYLYALDEWIFQEQYAARKFIETFDTHSLKGFGIENNGSCVGSCWCCNALFKRNRTSQTSNILLRIQRIEQNDYLWMDRFTIRNLELLSSPVENGITLLKVLDNTATPMGARLLKRWIVFPLKDEQKINERLDAVEYLILQTDLRNKLMHAMRQCGDLERLVSKIPLKKINA
jgi:DNA mismatch repair protein MutS